jgi:selenocysteine-specific elongation factor
VGTAGHIDHGKSTLVRALTGTDPDRLKEEKERGITIDLGFAHTDLGSGQVASFIDVPGHERFVRNMLAGAHGMDLALLVVAADESVMPQTREHFHICRLLGIPRGLVVLTKCDAADAASQALAELEVRELVKGSFLEAAPVLKVSARTGEGIAELREALRVAAGSPTLRPGGGLLRLPVDRVFTLRGFGTVVTGTLISGTLALGDELEVLPPGRRVRVRGLQVHGAAVTDVAAGHRAAINLAGVEVADLSRGDVIVRPGTLRPTFILDAVLSLLGGEKPLRDQTRVRVHAGSAEVLARIQVSGARAVEAGSSQRVQIRLERPAVVGRGDRLVIRAYSPARTIGGAVVTDPLPPKRKRHAIASATPLEAGLPDLAAARHLVVAAGARGLDAAALAARVTTSAESLSAELAADPEISLVGGEPGTFVSRAALTALSTEALARLEAFHREHPLRARMPREELRAGTFRGAAAGVFEAVLAELLALSKVRVQPDGISIASHAVHLRPEEEKARAELLAAAEQAGLAGLPAGLLPASGENRDPGVSARVARVMVADGTLRRVGDTLVLRSLLDRLRDDVLARWPPGSRLDVGGFKELTGLTRKHVIPLLEHLDRERVTRRVGAERTVLG